MSQNCVKVQFDCQLVLFQTGITAPPWRTTRVQLKRLAELSILSRRDRTEQEELEAKKRKIEDELKIGNITNKFAAHYDAN